MIRFKTLTVKNFMSVGNTTQGVNFDRQDLTLVLGQNLDLGGDDTGARNGTGKTTIINALSYALYGQALTNIRKENLINKTNSKAMLVSLDFEINGVDYRIERGRKPNVLKFYVNSEAIESKDDNSQGDSRETQTAIEQIVSMSHDMFKHILALNTYTEPFLSLKANDQRLIIEQLLGITLLSEKAENLKESMRQTKDSMSEEEFRIKGLQEANKRIGEQIEALKRRQAMWLQKQQTDCSNLNQAIEDLSHVDIERELSAHKDLDIYNNLKRTINETNKWLQSAQADVVRDDKLINRLKQEISSLENHTCPMCEQELHDSKHEQQLADKKTELTQAEQDLATHTAEVERQKQVLVELGGLGIQPRVFYDTLEQALNHKNTLETLERDLAARLAEVDPYVEQIQEMEQQALVEIDYDQANKLKHLLDHQDFLLKLLTSKDSFVRKKIIEQNLSYLNARLTYYLDRIGLPHTVVFQNDLTVMITELGRELDFDNLSRGERNRLILSLSWAFRDVYESLYCPINLLFIDELIDSGMDSSGVENAIAILKKMTRERNKSVWLVSHKDELVGRVENVLKVIKENGFTMYGSDTEIFEAI